MPYQEKPQFQEVEQSHAGEKVVLEGVKVTFVFDLAQGDGWTRQDFKVERDGCETKVKYWRPEKALSAGQVVTVVGGVEEYQGKKSVSVDAKKGGGVALDGEPLATVEPPAHNRAVPAQAAAPVPAQGATLVGHEVLWVELLDALKNPLEDDRARVAATAQWFIPLQQGKVTVDQIRNLIAILKDEVPF